MREWGRLVDARLSPFFYALLPMHRTPQHRALAQCVSAHRERADEARLGRNTHTTTGGYTVNVCIEWNSYSSANILVNNTMLATVSREVIAPQKHASLILEYDGDRYLVDRETGSEGRDIMKYFLSIWKPA